MQTFFGIEVVNECLHLQIRCGLLQLDFGWKKGKGKREMHFPFSMFGWDGNGKISTTFFSHFPRSILSTICLQILTSINNLINNLPSKKLHLSYPINNDPPKFLHPLTIINHYINNVPLFIRKVKFSYEKLIFIFHFPPTKIRYTRHT